MRRRTLIILALISLLLSYPTQLVVNTLLERRFRAATNIAFYRWSPDPWPNLWHDGVVYGVSWHGNRGFRELHVFANLGTEQHFLQVWRFNARKGTNISDSDGWLIRSDIDLEPNQVLRLFEDIPQSELGAIAREYRVGWPMHSMHAYYVSFRDGDHRKRQSWGQLQTPFLDRPTIVQPLWPGFIVNTLLYATAYFAAMLLISAPWIPSPWANQRRRHRRGLCPSCAYDLGGEFDAGCPECGWNHDSEPPAQAGGP